MPSHLCGDCGLLYSVGMAGLYRVGDGGMCGRTFDLKSYQMDINDRQFIEANIINFETVGLGYTRNIDHGILEGYELIYRKYLDQHFILTRWCGSCVFEMINRLKVYYEALPKVEEPKPKRGRPKK